MHHPDDIVTTVDRRRRPRTWLVVLAVVLASSFAGALLVGHWAAIQAARDASAACRETEAACQKSAATCAEPKRQDCKPCPKAGPTREPGRLRIEDF